MIIRILDNDPPSPVSLSLFVTTESKAEKKHLQSVLMDLFDYVEKSSGKKIKDRKEFASQETGDKTQTNDSGFRELPPQH